MPEFRRPPEECANCGAEIPRGAKACPECGADERTGWRETTFTMALNCQRKPRVGGFPTIGRHET
ncbi:MAG: zinc ribbon domain-containing protein [Opitutaceae bacterium]|nr:zinc ribbon domain-containing protein [Opitutaceae bacterium]